MAVKIGIIGGSGLDNPDWLRTSHDTYMGTPWGEPSSPILEGTIGDIPVAILARHGRNHTLAPSSVNYRANIQALKAVGCTCILATTAVGSLKEEIHPGDLIILDQFIDFTKNRQSSYFSYFAPHAPAHTPMADPYDAQLRAVLIQSCQKLHLPAHFQGTVITIEGPRFSTRAESKMFQSWGADVINMSIATETILANELALPYAAVAMSTDYDCWKQEEAPVTWEAISRVFQKNVVHVTQLLMESLPALKELYKTV